LKMNFYTFLVFGKKAKIVNTKTPKVQAKPSKPK